MERGTKIMPEAAETVQEIFRRCANRGSEGGLEFVYNPRRQLEHSREPDRKDGAAAGAVLHADGGAVHFGDPRDDGQPEPGAPGATAVATPEPPEDLLAFGIRHSRPTIHDPKHPRDGNRDLD